MTWPDETVKSKRGGWGHVGILALMLLIAGVLWGSGEASRLYAAPPLQRVTPTFTPSPTPTEASPPSPTPTPQPPTATPTEVPQAPSPTPPPENSKSPTPTPAHEDRNPEPKPPPGCIIRVEGFVFDSQGRPLVDVLVRLWGPGWSAEWRTDTNGFFYFNNLCTGDATVDAIIDDQVVARQPVRLEEATPLVQVTLHANVMQPSATPLPTAAPPTATPIPPTATAAPVPTATPQVVQRLPQTGAATLSFFLVAGALAVVMLGVRVVRQLSGHSS